MARIRALCALVSIAVSASWAFATTDYQLCAFNPWYGGVPWAMITPSYYASEYPNTTFHTKILNSTDSLRGIVQSYLTDGGSCDVLTNAAASSYCLALSPVMADTVAWVDGSSTSTDLSDKLNNPYFNRVIPTDAVGAGSAAIFVASQGWMQANVLCSDDSYGRSVADGFSSRYQRLGGQIEFSRCVSPNFSVQDLRDAANQILNGAQSRVIFFAGAFGTPGVEGLKESLAAVNAIVIFTESMCSSDYLSMFPGAFCAGYGIDDQAAALVQTAYNNRDTASEIALYGPLLDYAAGDTSYEIDFWAAMVVDATRAGLKAAYGYPSANQSLYPTISDYVRTITFEGLTGFVSFDENGDRVEAILIVYNSHPSPGNASVVELTSFATVSNGSVQMHSSGSSQYYIVDGVGQWLSSPPSALNPAKAGSTTFPYWVIAIIVVGVVLIAVVVIAARAAKSTERDSRDAPVNAEVPFTVMFTDIQSSTTQWALNPEVMGPAVDQHHDLIRRVLKEHHGYEVKTIGDAFMVAFKDPADAVRAAIHIQQTLFAAVWSESIDAVYRKSSETTPLEHNTYKELWSGIRVRIGIHTGLGSIKLDPVSRGYDYYGTVVNTAARVEGVGHGGQILLTKDTYDAVNKASHKTLEDQVVVSSLGPQPLRGLSGPTELYQLLPAEFAARDFPALRLDIEIEIEANDPEDEKDTGKGDTTSTHSSMSSLAKETPEGICKMAARRTNVAARDLHSSFLLVKALYSTVPAKDRTKLISDLAKRWRVPLQAKDRDSECALARLVVKAAPVAATFRNPYSVGDIDVNRYNSQHGSSRPSRAPSFGGAPDRTPVDRTASFGAAERVESFGAGTHLEARNASPPPA